MKDAASAGFYTSATGKKYPRLQLLTVEGLMAGTQRAEHPDAALQTPKRGETRGKGVASCRESRKGRKGRKGVAS